MWVWVIKGHKFTPWTMVRGISSSEINSESEASDENWFERTLFNSTTFTVCVIGIFFAKPLALDVPLALLGLRALWNVIALTKLVAKSY